MRGSIWAITEIIAFVLAASLLGLLLGLLIRRPRPQSVRAADEAGPGRKEVERRLVAAQNRGEDLESKLSTAVTRLQNLTMENSKLEELRVAAENAPPLVDTAALEARGVMVDRLERDLAQRDATIEDKDRELESAARIIAALEPADDGGEPVAPADHVPPRQHPTGPGAVTDVIEFEVGGAD